GFPMPRNNSRDINSKDSLINYLRHPAGLFIERPDHSALRTAQGSPGANPQSGVPERRMGPQGSAIGERNSLNATRRWAGCRSNPSAAAIVAVMTGKIALNTAIEIFETS